MDQVECPNCQTSSCVPKLPDIKLCAQHHCEAIALNSESSISEEKTEGMNFNKSTSDIPDVGNCYQETFQRKREHCSFEQSSSRIIEKEREPFDSGAENVDLTLPSHAPSNTPQCFLSGLISDCPDGTILPEETEGINFHRFPQEPVLHIEVDQDDSGGTNTVVSADLTGVSYDAVLPWESSRSPYIYYPCSICGRRYSNHGQLKSHIGVHTGEKKFKCLECGRGFTLKKHFDSHRQCYEGQDPSMCKGCKESFTFKCARDSHYCSVYGNKINKCHLCEQGYNSNSSLRSHMSKYH